MIQGIRQSVAGRHAAGLTAAKLLWTEYNYTQKFHRPKKGARGNGIRFENKVVAQLEKNFKGFMHGMAFCYSTEYSPRSICIPDGVLINDHEVVVVEIKLRHVLDAWFQLRKLYQPVVSLAFGRKVRMLEICQVYDPSVPFPEPFMIVQDLDTFLRSGSELGCMLWGR